MQLVSSLILRQLYTRGSLKSTENGIQFSIKNRLSDAKLTGMESLTVAGEKIPLDKVNVQLASGLVSAASISRENPIPFNVRDSFHVLVEMPQLEEGKYELEIAFHSDPFGEMKFSAEDSITSRAANRIVIPRDDIDDYSDEIIKERQNFVEEFTGAKLNHIRHYSFDAAITKGNCEHFSGVAQIPIGFAGPIKINGEHAQGEFLIPMATTEGTLVASYNRGIKVLNLCGGVKTTVLADAMQRAPVFEFDDARGSRDFSIWVQANKDRIAEEAEATTSIGKLQYIDTYLSNKFAFMRFNYSTGDAAGQNMVGRATFAACSWILDHYPPKIKDFFLESNFATDKKASQVNIMRTRGKRVSAECVVKRDILMQKMRVEPERLFKHYGIANIGSILSGANNNGLHSANAITAIFIATGQDVANVSESSAGLIYLELTREKDLYMNITIPSLIVATYGGGTNLATQEECLSMMGCVGKGKVNKLAEIIAGVVLAGELSLGSAISSNDWVSSHEQYGRNR